MGSTALVVHNENDNPATLLAQGEPTIGLHAARRRASKGESECRTSCNPAGAASRSNDGHVPADAAQAVDDDASRPWTNRAAQQPGVEVGHSVVQVVAACSARPRTPGLRHVDYPRGYSVSTSVDGTTWSVPLTGPVPGSCTNIALPGHPARYVRVVQTHGCVLWWTVADLRVYR